MLQLQEQFPLTLKRWHQAEKPGAFQLLNQDQNNLPANKAVPCICQPDPRNREHLHCFFSNGRPLQRQTAR